MLVFAHLADRPLTLNYQPHPDRIRQALLTSDLQCLPGKSRRCPELDFCVRDAWAGWLSLQIDSWQFKGGGRGRSGLN